MYIYIYVYKNIYTNISVHLWFLANHFTHSAKNSGDPNHLLVESPNHLHLKPHRFTRCIQPCGWNHRVQVCHSSLDIGGGGGVGSPGNFTIEVVKHWWNHGELGGGWGQPIWKICLSNWIFWINWGWKKIKNKTTTQWNYDGKLVNPWWRADEHL